MRARRTFFVLGFVASAYVAVAGCGDDDSTSSPTDAGTTDTSARDTSARPPPGQRSPEYTGAACTVPADCYPKVDGGSIKGGIRCIDKVEGGYCSHVCQSDADCCAAIGECKPGLKHVCAPFESAGEKYCFLSCEDQDIAAAASAGASDAGANPEDFCHRNAASDFVCRSSGGGRENRQVCLPSVSGPPPADAGTDAPEDAPFDALGDAPFDAPADAPADAPEDAPDAD